jgi:hypothetical protein
MNDLMSFEAHKEATAKDCDDVAQMLTDLASQVRGGNMEAFERFWTLNRGKIQELQVRMILRYEHRRERLYD